MNSYSIILIIGISVIGVMAVIFGNDMVKLSISTEKYSLYVDPLLDKQSLFVMGRVTLQNTGSETITNLHINFGDGDILDISSLEPGKKIIVSPPPDNSMQFVMISADNEVFVNKAYREMPKMVGMMGS